MYPECVYICMYYLYVCILVRMCVCISINWCRYVARLHGVGIKENKIIWDVYMHEVANTSLLCLLIIWRATESLALPMLRQQRVVSFLLGPCIDHFKRKHQKGVNSLEVNSAHDSGITSPLSDSEAILSKVVSCSLSFVLLHFCRAAEHRLYMQYLDGIRGSGRCDKNWTRDQCGRLMRRKHGTHPIDRSSQLGGMYSRWFQSLATQL